MLIDDSYLRNAFRRPELVDQFFGSSVEGTFALQWVLENEMVIDHLQCCSPAHYKQIKFEDLVDDLEEHARKIFTFLNLSYTPQTEAYLQALRAHSGKQQHERSTFVAQDRQGKSRRPDLTQPQFENIQAVVSQSYLLSMWN